MNIEYMLFNIFVVMMPIMARLLIPRMKLPSIQLSLLSTMISAVVFIPLDMLMATRFWSYNERFIIGPRLLGLPVEELLFFFTVPFACLCVWENININQPNGHIKHGELFAVILSVVLPITLYATNGKPYAIVMALLSLAIIGLDSIFNIKVIRKQNFSVFIAIVTMFTLIFNGYLTARPVVLYNPAYISGLRIYSIPIEDFLFGWGMVTLTVGAYEFFKIKILPLRKSEDGSVSQSVSSIHHRDQDSR